VPARAAALLIAGTLALLALAGTAGAATLVKVGDFPQPIYVTAPPGDPHRLFVVEKDGQVELLHDGVRKPFLTVPGDIVSADQQGLFSMAFAPDYATSGLFYVMYTAARPGDPPPAGDVIKVAEFRRSATDPDSADPASNRTVLAIDHPDRTIHHGGQLQFGPDGHLYVSTGDGDGPPENAQNTGVLLGKLLRIDPRQRGGAQYTVPAGNPFTGTPGARPEIFAYGLRNPWRFSFDRARGDLAIGDVGEKAREEIDFAPRGTGGGANYGWRCREGFATTPYACSSPGPFTEPVFDYPHVGSGCTGSITGGYVVRNHDLDSLYGRYVYADYCGTSGIRSLVLAQPHASDDQPTGLASPNVYSFGEDSCGHLYLVNGAGEVDVILDDAGAFTPCPEPQKPPPPKPPARDVKPPTLELSRAKRQSLSPHRSLYVRVRCDERCTVVAFATIVVPGAARPFKVVVGRSLGPGKRVRLRLLLSPHAAEVARRALRNGKRVHAALRVVARDAAGNRAVVRKGVRVLL
jgi:hypothetical protein